MLHAWQSLINFIINAQPSFKIMNKRQKIYVSRSIKADANISRGCLTDEVI